MPEQERVETAEAQPSPALAAAAPAVARLSDARTLAARALALQRMVGNAATARLLQREVRVNNGATRVNEAFYTSGAGRNIGTRRRVSSLIGDSVKRVFNDEAELRDYANGRTDYIGDVVTSGRPAPFWFRLPPSQLTVLGEEHQSPQGNVEDVIVGLGTSRFMYEPYHHVSHVGPVPMHFAGTEARMAQQNRTYRVNSLVNPNGLAPDLENIVFKAMTGAEMTRNEYIPASPSVRRRDFSGRASTSQYAGGERVALYLSFAIHIAQDLSSQAFPAPSPRDTPYVRATRQLRTVFIAHQAELEALMRAKDRDDLIGIYELTAPGNFANLAAVRAFCAAFHDYGTRYVEQLGIDTHNRTLERIGRGLHANQHLTLDDLSPAREQVMWHNIELARLSGLNYLIVGMGDAHRRNLRAKLNRARIPHFKVDVELRRQETEINRHWVP